MSQSELSEFGSSLRAARERRGLELKEIAERTKISIGILRALENGDVSGVPGGLFARSFVRAYAREVGLEPEATVAAFLKACPERRPDEVERGKAPRAAATRPTAPVDVATTAIRLALMSIPVVAVLIFFGTRAGPDTENTRGGEAGIDGVAAQAQDEPLGSPLTIDVHPSGPCWVSLVADGQEVFAGVVSGNQRRVYEAREGFVLSVGDAGLFDFSVNQQPGRPLGSSGETVTVEITQENFLEFVAP